MSIFFLELTNETEESLRLRGGVTFQPDCGEIRDQPHNLGDSIAVFSGRKSSSDPFSKSFDACSVSPGFSEEIRDFFDFWSVSRARINFGNDVLPPANVQF